MAFARLLLLALAACVVSASVRLENNIPLFYDSEYVPHYGQPISQCELLLQVGWVPSKLVPAPCARLPGCPNSFCIDHSPAGHSV
jgi:hypothetical protein